MRTGYIISILATIALIFMLATIEEFTRPLSVLAFLFFSVAFGFSMLTYLEPKD